MSMNGILYLWALNAECFCAWNKDAHSFAFREFRCEQQGTNQIIQRSLSCLCLFFLGQFRNFISRHVYWSTVTIILNAATQVVKTCIGIGPTICHILFDWFTARDFLLISLTSCCKVTALELATVLDPCHATVGAKAKSISPRKAFGDVSDILFMWNVQPALIRHLRQRRSKSSRLFLLCPLLLVFKSS